MERNDHAGKPVPTCPKCGRPSVLRIVYGLQPGELTGGGSADRVKIGGCIISDDSPQYACETCGHEWGQVMSPEWVREMEAILAQPEERLLEQAARARLMASDRAIAKAPIVNFGSRATLSQWILDFPDPPSCKWHLDTSRTPFADRSINVVQVPLSSSVTLTLVGRDPTCVAEFLSSTEGEWSVWRLYALAMLLSYSRTECLEIEIWRVGWVSLIESIAKSRFETNCHPLWEGVDFFESYQDALSDTWESANLFRTDEFLSTERSDMNVSRPESIMLDDAIVERLLAHPAELTDLLLQLVSDEGSVMRLGEGLKRRLEARGRAVSARQAPPAKLAAIYRFPEMQELQLYRQDRPHDEQVAELLTPAVVARLPGIDDLVYVKPLSAEYSIFRTEAFLWLRIHARHLLQLQQLSEETRRSLSGLVPGRPYRYRVQARGCCSAGMQWDPWGSECPTDLPPYHVGCDARLEVEELAGPPDERR